MNETIHNHIRLLKQSGDYETLIAAALYLMTRYQQTGNHCLADGITAHLAALAEHPGCNNACLAHTARKLCEEWDALRTIDSVKNAGPWH